VLLASLNFRGWGSFKLIKINFSVASNTKILRGVSDKLIKINFSVASKTKILKWVGMVSGPEAGFKGIQVGGH
jgi:hypothetical protein